MIENSLVLVTLDDAHIEVVKELERGESDNDLLRLLNGIGKAEFSLIGELIQIYCTADVLCRGLIAMMREHRLGVSSNFAYDLNDKDVLVHTRGEAVKTTLDIHKDGVISAIETIEMHRIFRHTFSHWIVYKHVNDRYLVAITKSRLDAIKRDGVELNDGKAKFAVFRIDDLMTELRKVKAHTKFLADLHFHLETTL